MKSLRLTASLAAAILTAAILTPAARAQERIEVPWAELGPALAGHIVSTVLPDGTVLRGHVLDVSADQLRFEANKTSNGALYPKEELSLARNQLKVFSYTQKRGRGRAIGAAIGAAAIVASFYIPIEINSNEAGDGNATAQHVAMGGIGAGLGYLVGNQVDKRTITVIVAPD